MVCLSHMNQLPLRNLSSKVDSTTTAPTTYSDVIEKLLNDCEKRSIVSFEKIEGILPDISEALTNVTYLVDWQQQYSPPPILRDVSNETLYSLASGGNDEVIFLRLLCHTQGVEKAVKIVTE
ncbi:hypothetical protein ILUMI_15412, partial [Ignelater luminosus]